MKEYIKREEITERLEYVIKHGIQDEYGRHLVSAEAVLIAINGLDTADVVEVVRCMDCVNGYPQTLPDGRKVVVCTNVFAFADVGHDPNFYCKEGENK